jgi:hypothetical protein
MGSKLNNGYVGSNELEFVNTRGYSNTDGKGILSGTKNYLEEEKKQWRHESDWVRNPQWLEIPYIPEGEQKIYALYGIQPNSNIETNTICFRIDGGNWTVDWGDGTTEGYNSTNTAGHTYDFNSIDASTETDEGYRQVLVTITPDTDITRMYLNNTLTILGLRGEHQKYLLDLAARLPNVSCSYFSLPTSDSLERVVVYEIENSGSMANMFSGRRGLQHIEFPYDVSNVTSFNSTFTNCVKLKYPPALDTSSGTDFYRMFYLCNDLRRIPKYDLSNATTVRQMFVGCRELKYLPELNITSTCTEARELFSGCDALRECPVIGDTSAIVLPTSFFSNCINLKEIPELDFSSATNATSMFNNCTNLEKINRITFSSAITNMRGICYGCYQLETAEFVGTSNVTDFYQAFRSCEKLRGFTLDTSSGTNMYQMFYNNYNLKNNQAGFDISNVTNVGQLFNGCSTLEKLENLDFSSVSSASNIVNAFSSMASLRKVSGFTGPSYTHTFISTPLEPDSIRNIFYGLPTVVGQTITLTNTSGILSGGVTAGDIQVATDKGWTVTT